MDTAVRRVETHVERGFGSHMDLKSQMLHGLLDERKEGPWDLWKLYITLSSDITKKNVALTPKTRTGSAPWSIPRSGTASGFNSCPPMDG